MLFWQFYLQLDILMLMDKKVVAAMVIAAVIIGIGVTIFTNSLQSSEETAGPSTSVTSSTSKTEDSEANITTDNSGTTAKSTNNSKNKNSDDKNSDEPTAAYVEFSVDTFKKTGGTRVLFFHLATSEACRQLDKDIKKNIDEFKDDTTIFKIDFKKEKDIAKAYGVVKEGTILKYDDQTEVSGVFIAYDYPSAAALITNLGI